MYRFTAVPNCQCMVHSLYYTPILPTVPHLPTLQILKREESAGGVVEDDKEGQVRLQDPVIKKSGGGCCRRS